MRLFITSLFIVVSSFYLLGQSDGPVSWSASAIAQEDNQYTIEITATIQPGWVIYAIDTPAGGPIPTEVTILESDAVKLKGELFQVSKAKQGFDNLFEIDVKKIEHQAVFSQTIIVTKDDTEVKGEAYFMTCNGQQCLPPTTHQFVTKLNS